MGRPTRLDRQTASVETLTIRWWSSRGGRPTVKVSHTGPGQRGKTPRQPGAPRLKQHGGGEIDTALRACAQKLSYELGYSPDARDA
jgi:hypothetical protein